MRRWLSIALALLGASALAVSVQAGHWWSFEGIHIGPTGSELCGGDGCRPGDSLIRIGSEHWTRTGMAVWAGGLLTALLLVIIAGATAAKRKPAILSKTTLVSLVTTTAAGTWFYVSFPGMQGAHFEPARDAFLFAGGIVLGAIGTALIWKRAKT